MSWVSEARGAVRIKRSYHLRWNDSSHSHCCTNQSRLPKQEDAERAFVPYLMRSSVSSWKRPTPGHSGPHQGSVFVHNHGTTRYERAAIGAAASWVADVRSRTCLSRPTDAQFSSMLSQSCCLRAPTFPPLAIAEALQDCQPSTKFGSCTLSSWTHGAHGSTIPVK